MAIFISLMVLGVLLIFAEKLMPKGVFGTMGVVFLVAGIGVGYYTFETTTAHFITAGTLVGLIISFTLWMRFFPKSRIAQKYVSTGSVGEPDTKYRRYLGKIGMAKTRLGGRLPSRSSLEVIQPSSAILLSRLYAVGFLSWTLIPR